MKLRIALALIILCFGSVLASFGQKKTQVADKQSGKNLDSLFTYGYEYLAINIDSGLAVSTRILKIANKKQNIQYQGYAQYLRAEAYVSAAKFDLAADYYKIALEIFSESKDTLGFLVFIMHLAFCRTTTINMTMPFITTQEL